MLTIVAGYSALMPLFSHKTRYATQGNLYRTSIRTDYGKLVFRYKAVQVWESVPSHLKSLTEPTFRKYVISNSKCHSMPSIYCMLTRE